MESRTTQISLDVQDSRGIRISRAPAAARAPGANERIRKPLRLAGRVPDDGRRVDVPDGERDRRRGFAENRATGPDRFES